MFRSSRRRLSGLRRYNGNEDEVEVALADCIQKRNCYFNAVKRAKSDDWKDFVTSRGNSDPWGVVYKLK